MKTHILTSTLLLLIASACADFDQINKNPNNPESVPPELLIPPIISTAAGGVTGSGTRAGQYVQHLAWIGGTSEGDGRYNLTGASYREEWNAALRLIKDVNQLRESAIATRQPQYEAVALVCKAYILSVVTDAFGDIPYREAGKGNVAGLEFPRYQAQQEVNADILADLEEANQIFKALPTGATINRDILFSGDPSAWRKFANSLKVRVLMRQSRKVDVKAAVAAIFNNPAEYPVFAAEADQATLRYDNRTNIYQWFIVNPPADGSGVNFGDNARVSQVMVDLLQRDADPRLPIYAAPTRNSHAARRVNPATLLEYRGQPAGLSAAEQEGMHSRAGLDEGDFSVISRRIRMESRAFLMTLSELLLLKTEAILAGMGVNGDAAATYRAAVTASFDKWPQLEDAPYISDAMKTTYFAQPSVALDPVNGARQVAEQLWIDSFLNGFEGWAGWRRTGVPTIVPGPSVLSPIPVRYVYSDNEQNNPSLLLWVNEMMNGQMPDHNVKVWFQP
ncbi:MAG: SusD/RagB family nutrient-binding outer membrane lipoprotein [Odoribacteraceae bacterium]|jgi:hypothetical protein|nr:SusD/RagB family nutrient-binding outer membrane lipoprotein [Odoribacteraceae bacterium]